MDQFEPRRSPPDNNIPHYPLYPLPTWCVDGVSLNRYYYIYPTCTPYVVSTSILLDGVTPYLGVARLLLVLTKCREPLPHDRTHNDEEL